MNELFPWLTSIALAILLLGLVVVAYRQKKLTRQLSELAELRQQLEHQQQAVAQVQHSERALATDVNELRAGAVAMGRRVGVVEQGLGELAQSQPNPEELEPERRMYRRAVRMVELGADIEEIIQECELPRAEAELLFSLHRQKQT